MKTSRFSDSQIFAILKKPSCRREMALYTVERKNISMRLSCPAFGISQTCYRYQEKQSAENVVIADHLIRLTHNQHNW